MKMEIIESDLKQLFQWIKTLDARIIVIETQLEKLAIDINYFLDQEEKYLRENK
jgi:hypothetical protein